MHTAVWQQTTSCSIWLACLDFFQVAETHNEFNSSSISANHSNPLHSYLWVNLWDFLGPMSRESHVHTCGTDFDSLLRCLFKRLQALSFKC
jgi:hypothetical protein